VLSQVLDANGRKPRTPENPACEIDEAKILTKKKGTN